MCPARGQGGSGVGYPESTFAWTIDVPEVKGNDWYVFVFTATEFEGGLIESSPEGHLEWIKDDKLTGLNLWESDHIFLPWLEDGKFFSAKFEYEGDVMQGYDIAFYGVSS